MYTDIDKPLYTVVSFDQYSEVYGEFLQALKNFGVFYWPRITPTQRNQRTAEENFKKMHDESKKKLVFKIYMSEQKSHNVAYRGKVPTSIDNIGLRNEQVILMPQFCFQVVSK